MGKQKHRLRALESIVQPKARELKTTVCSIAFCWSSVKTVSLVLLYYCFSISLTFYNQRFIHAFKFPLSITMVHLVTKFLLSIMVRGIISCKTGKERVTLAWGPYIRRVAPPGIASSIDIGLSNWSFEFITVSLYTMTKSTVIIFILAFSILFKLERPRCSLVFVVLFISLGLFMFTFESTQFNLTGFLLCLGASFLSGLRWTLSQLVMQKNELGLTNPLDMMYHIQPWMIAALFPLSAAFEGVHVATSEHTFNYHSPSLLGEHLAILFAGAFLAFGLELSEFLLLSQTSSLTLSISGIVKEVVTLCLAAAINGDVMAPLNVIGLMVVLLGITIHIIMKALAGDEDKRFQQQISEKANQDEAVEMLLRNGRPAVHDDEDEENEVFNVQRDRQR